MQSVTSNSDASGDLLEFMKVLRQALLMIVKWIDKRYEMGEHKPKA